MSLTLAQVVTAARDHSPWFDETRIPGGVAARMASDLQRELIARAVRVDPDLLAASQDVTLAYGSAISLNAHEIVTRLDANFTDTSREPERVPLIASHRAHLFENTRAGYLQSGSLYLTGDSATWSGVDDLTVTYIALASDFSAESGTFALPDDAKGVLVARLAHKFALRVNGMPVPQSNQRVQVDVGGYAEEARAAEEAWVRALINQRQRQQAMQFEDTEL